MEDNKYYIIREFYKLHQPNLKLVKEAIERGEPITLTGILQKANTLNRNGRVYPYDILRREATKYMEAVEENRALGECVPAGTEILTKDGWINIEDANIDDEIFTLNIETGALEVQSVTNTIKKSYNDKIIHIHNSSSLDMMITKKHKVVLWDRNGKTHILTGEELYEKIKINDPSISKYYIKNSGTWIGKSPEFFNIPGTEIKIKSEDWAAFLGIFISEGHCSGTKGGRISPIVGITQKKEESKQLIKELLDRLPFEYVLSNNRQFLIRNKYLYDHLFELGNSFTKKIPQYAKDWSVELLEVLLKWLLIGDGRNRHDEKGNLLREYYTTSPQLSEDVFEIMLKLGKGATTSIRLQKDREIEGRTILAENSKILHIVHEKTTNGIYLDCRFLHAELVDFNDDVYCVEVPNHTWMMRYNGKASWTHNCDHPDSAVVALRGSSHKIVDMWWQGEELYGKVEILDPDCDAARCLRGLVKSNVMLGISSRGVGSVKTVKGEDIVQDDFELIAFDIVSSPSTPGAYLFKEGKSWGMTPITEELYKKIKWTCENGVCKMANMLDESKIIIPGKQEIVTSENCECEKYKTLFNLTNTDFWKKI